MISCAQFASTSRVRLIRQTLHPSHRDANVSFSNCTCQVVIFPYMQQHCWLSCFSPLCECSHLIIFLYQQIVLSSTQTFIHKLNDTKANVRFFSLHVHIVSKSATWYIEFLAHFAINFAFIWSISYSLKILLYLIACQLFCLLYLYEC